MRGVMHHAEEILAIRHDDNFMFPRPHAQQLDLILLITIPLGILIFFPGRVRARAVPIAPVLRIQCARGMTIGGGLRGNRSSQRDA